MTVIKLLWIAHYIISKIKFKSKFVKYTTKQVLTGSDSLRKGTGKGFPRSATFPSGRFLTMKREPKKH